MTRNVLSSVDLWWLLEEPVVKGIGSEKSRFNLPDIHSDALSPSGIHVATFSTDYLCDLIRILIVRHEKRYLQSSVPVRRRLFPHCYVRLKTQQSFQWINDIRWYIQ